MTEQSRTGSEGPVALRETDNYRMHSRYVEAELEIRVARPIPGFMSPSTDRSWVLYVPDGDLFFGMATEVTRLMHQLYGELPPILVVGIGYGTNDPRIQGETRNRDLTPTADAQFLEMGRKMNPEWEPLLPEGRQMGRADAFLDFIEKELKPKIEENYPLADEGSVLFGSSLGGLFATYALLTRPNAFDRYVIASPALWWDDEASFDLEEKVAAERDDLAARAFFAVGEREEGVGIPFLDAWKMVTNTERMVQLLVGRAYPSLDVSMEVLPGETHTSAVPVGLTRGLRAVFGGMERDHRR